MIKINPNRSAKLIEQLLLVWQDSVLHTHKFLDHQAINDLKPHVKNALQGIETLFVLYIDDEAKGFIGTEDNKIEMFFLHSSIIGKGFGKKLILLAINDYNVSYVDVNEQNPDAVAFYQHFGFKVYTRTDEDVLGNPYPILKMHRVCEQQV